jgi:hypothetical protein
MRSGKLHYLDHPVLGVLVQAERYEPPVPEPEPETTEDQSTQPEATNAVNPTHLSPETDTDSAKH